MNAGSNFDIPCILALWSVNLEWVLTFLTLILISGIGRIYKIETELRSSEYLIVGTAKCSKQYIVLLKKKYIIKPSLFCFGTRTVW